MYTMIERWTGPQERMEETSQRAQREWFPKLQAAPGFVSFYLVPDDTRNIQTAIMVWESKAQAEAFAPQAKAWQAALNEMGHTMETSNQGETVITIEPQR